MSVELSLDVRQDAPPSETIVAAFSSPGMAGLTAAEYLITELDLTEDGHISVNELPSIAPFHEGRPYHPTRLFSRDDLDITVLVSELPVPFQATDAFGRRILEWVLDENVSEVSVLSGVPTRADPAEQWRQQDEVYYVASDDYREYRLADANLTPMGGGFLNGTHASLISRAIDTPLRVGVLLTPARQQPVAVGAAVRLVNAVDAVYGTDVDTAGLEAFADEMEAHYGELTRRLEEEQAPEDRMFM